MKISIITATYNSATHILTAIQSVQEQSYPCIELIVVDGGSTDNTVEIVSSNFVGDLKIISERDEGIYDALNKGVKLATGDVMGFVHSDDYLAGPEVLSKIARSFEKEEVDGLYGDLQYVDKQDTSKIIRYWKSEDFRDSFLKKGWMPAHPTLFLRKEVYDKHGLFNLDYKIAADYDLMLRIFSDTELKFHYLPKVITKMRLGGASNRSLKNILQKSKEDLKALKANKIRKPYFALMNKNFSKVSQFISK